MPGSENRPGQARPLGQPNFLQFEPGGTGTPGLGSGERRGQQLSNGIDPYEARIHDFLEKDWNSGGWGREYFSPSYRMFSYLLTGYETKLKGYDGGDYFLGKVPEGTSDEAIEAMRNLAGQTAIALGILAYPQWGAKLQSKFREDLPTAGYTFFCEEFLQQYLKRDTPIDYDREERHDHYVKLPEAGKKLLKHITNVLGIPYDTQQDTFYFHTVLNQPEPIIREE